MLTCSHCQTENPDDARICRECGNQLPTQGLAQADSPVPEAPRSAPATCPSCGEPAQADSQFCSSCGKSFSTVAYYASFWRRFGGYLLDGIIVGIPAVIITSIISAIILSAAPEIAFTQEQVQEQEDATRNATIASFAISFVFGLSYYVGLNANGGTFGKRIVGLRLEDAETGKDIGYARALVRYIVVIASALALLLGYLWCIWDDRKQTWHDKAAGSVVVHN